MGDIVDFRGGKGVPPEEPAGGITITMQVRSDRPVFTIDGADFNDPIAMRVLAERVLMCAAKINWAASQQDNNLEGYWRAIGTFSTKGQARLFHVNLDEGDRRMVRESLLWLRAHMPPAIEASIANLQTKDDHPRE